jgi:hypothetical protein
MYPQYGTSEFFRFQRVQSAFPEVFSRKKFMQCPIVHFKKHLKAFDSVPFLYAFLSHVQKETAGPGFRFVMPSLSYPESRPRLLLF